MDSNRIKLLPHWRLEIKKHAAEKTNEGQSDLEVHRVKSDDNSSGATM